MSDKLVMQLMVLSEDVVTDDVDFEVADADRVREVVRTHDHVCIYIHPESNECPDNTINLPFVKDSKQDDESYGAFQPEQIGLGWENDNDPNKVWMERLVKAAENGIDALIEAVAA